MKKTIMGLVLVIVGIMLSGCGNKEFVGYWCRYDEASIITVMLNDDLNEADAAKIKEKLAEYGDINNFATYTKEDYAKLINASAEGMDIYATYVVSYPSNDYIGTLVNELNQMSGVHEAVQASAKNNLLLYELKKDGNYTFTDSDEASKDDYITGKYKLKNGVITFTDKKDKKTSLLYTKNGYLCVDADCNKIFFKSNENCEALK